MEVQFYTVRPSGKHTVVEFQTASLMNPLELEQIGAGLFKLVDEEKHDRLVLDFSKVQYLSSQVIGILLTLNKKLTGAASGITDNLVLCGVGPQLLELLKISRLERILTIKASQKEALAE